LEIMGSSAKEEDGESKGPYVPEHPILTLSFDIVQ